MTRGKGGSKGGVNTRKKREDKSRNLLNSLRRAHTKKKDQKKKPKCQHEKVEDIVSKQLIQSTRNFGEGLGGGENLEGLALWREGKRGRRMGGGGTWKT